MSKQIKKVLSLLLVAALLFGAAPLNGFVGLELPKFSALFAPVVHAAYSSVQSERAKDSSQLPGDVDGNGTVTLRDAAMISRYLAGGWDITLNVQNADVDRSSTVTLRDAALISRYVAGGWNAELLKPTELVETTSDEEFNSACAELISQSLESESFDAEEALEDPYYFGRVVVSFDDYSAIDFNTFGAASVIIGDDGTVVMQFDDRDQAERCAHTLNGLSGVAFAEADAYVSAPEDVEVEELESMPNSSWGEKYINADKYAYYLENNNFNKEMTVAVVDSGVEQNHPFLTGRLSTSGYNTLDDNDNPADDTGHGTHVAGIVVDCTNNLNVKILPIKALSAKGGTWLSIVNGITYAANQKADVINLSLEAPNSGYSKYVEKAVQYAIERNCVVVAAAGNGVPVEGDPTARNPQDTARVCPANLEEAIVVGALGQDGEKGYFSNYGATVDVIAPGMAIPSSYLNGGKKLMWGTSQAAPHIAAVAAMFKLSHPELKPAQIEALIKQYCVDKGPEGRDAFYGDGCPDMYDAIPDCTVSFNSNGGSSVSPKTTKNSSTVVLPKPTKSYKVTFNANGGSLSSNYYDSQCTFDGWYTTSSFNDSRHPSGESFMLLQDQTLYAKWMNAYYDKSKAPKATRTNYYLEDWYTSASGGTRMTGSYPIQSNIIVYAHWAQYKITYYANGGSGAPSDQNGYGSVTLSSTKPTRSGYKFLGWSTDSGASYASYSSGGSFTLSSNTDLYAIWAKKSITLSIKSSSNNIDINRTGVQVSSTSVGWKVPLPTVTCTNLESGTSGGWEIVGGNAVFYNGSIYQTQPGTVSVRYKRDGIYSEVFTYTLTLYKTTTANNTIRKTPDGDKTGYVVPGNTKVNILEFQYHNDSNAQTGPHLWGKVSYNGTTGWITCLVLS